MAQVDNLIVKFGADFKELLNAFNEAEARTSQFRRKVTSDFEGLTASVDRVSRGFREALAALGVAFSVGKMIEFAKGTLEWADNLEQLSKRLKTTSESLQAFILGGREVGLTEQQVIQGLKQFELAASQMALGRGRGRDIFQQMQLSVADLDKGFDSFIRKFADRLREFNQPSQIEIIRRLFGTEEAGRWLDYLRQGSGHIDDMVAKLRELGLGVQTAEAAKLKREFEEAADAINTALRQALVDLLPIIKVVLDAVRELVNEIKNAGNFEIRIRPPSASGEPTQEEGYVWRPGMPGFRRYTQKSLTTAPPPGFRRNPITGLPMGVPSAANPGEPLPAPGFQGVPAPGMPGVGTRQLPAAGGAAAAQAIENLLLRIRRDAEVAIAALTQGPKEAAWTKLREELEKVHGTQVQVNAAEADFNRMWEAQGQKALKDFGEENANLRAQAMAEAGGRRDLMAVLQLEFELRKKFGAAFVEAHKAEIEALARERYAIQENMRLMTAAWDDLRSVVGSSLSDFSSALLDFGNTNEKVWERIRNAAVRALNQIADMIFKLSVINPLMNYLFEGTPGYRTAPTISDLFSKFAGGAVSSVFSGGAGLGGSILGGLLGGFGFQHGTQFTVGGRSGADANFFPMRLSRGERVTVETPEQVRQTGGGSVTLVGSDSAQVEIADVRQALRQLGVRVTQVDRSIEPRAINANIDARRRGGQAAAY